MLGCLVAAGTDGHARTLHLFVAIYLLASRRLRVPPPSESAPASRTRLAAAADVVRSTSRSPSAPRALTRCRRCADASRLSEYYTHTPVSPCVRAKQTRGSFKTKKNAQNMSVFVGRPSVCKPRLDYMQQSH